MTMKGTVQTSSKAKFMQGANNSPNDTDNSIFTEASGNGGSNEVNELTTAVRTARKLMVARGSTEWVDHMEGKHPEKNKLASAVKSFESDSTLLEDINVSSELAQFGQPLCKGLDDLSIHAELFCKFFKRSICITGCRLDFGVY